MKNSFFTEKVWTANVTWAILEVSPTTPSCRKPEKPSKNGFFPASDTGRRSIQGGNVFLTGDRISFVRGKSF